MREMSFRRQKLAFSVQGEGPALFFIHGFGEDSRVWDDFAKPFLSRHTVVCPDLPGFGHSPTLPGAGIDDMAEAVHAVAEHLGLSDITLIGHSMGGYVSLAFAEKWPEQVRALGLFHSHPYPDGEDKKENRLKSMDFVRRHGSAPYVAQLIPGLFAPAFAQRNPEVIRHLTDRAAAYDPEGIAQALDAMRLRPDRSEVLKNAPFPVIFLIGTEDQAIPAELSKQQTALPPVASIHYLEGVGHMGMFEAEKEVQDILEKFIELLQR
jgi:pimeloyl-ACP methyl ester carboxylesterase